RLTPGSGKSRARKNVYHVSRPQRCYRTKNDEKGVGRSGGRHGRPRGSRLDRRHQATGRLPRGKFCQRAAYVEGSCARVDLSPAPHTRDLAAILTTARITDPGGTRCDGRSDLRPPPEGQPGTLELVDLRRNLPKSSP